MSLLLATFIFYFIVLTGTLIYALLKGGREERTGAITLLLCALLSQVASVMGHGPRLAQGWGAPEFDVMAIDAAGCIAFAAIAYRSKKFWPIWAAASQLVAALTHLVVVFNPSIVRTLYATAQPFWVFPVIIAIAVGTRTHQRSLG